MKILNKKSHKTIFAVISLIVISLTVLSLLLIYMTNGNKSSSIDSESSDDHLTATQKLGGGSISSPKGEDSGQETPMPDGNVVPIKPSGTFVSNHRPNLSGKPAPNTINSTCSTTPGASCTIRFTSGNLVKSLPSKFTDSSGNVSWNWKIQDIGLTVGTWKIEAVASIGNNSVEEPDALDLVISE